jgi:hypothetical protein
MKTLIEILKIETETLRIQYLNFVKEYSIKNYNRIIERLKWSEIDWCKFLGLTPQFKNHIIDI